MLDGRAVLQAVVAAETRIERAVRDLAEVRIVARADLVVLRDVVAVGRQRAAREVGVGPRARVGKRGDRVEQVGERAHVGRHVLAEVRLERRLAVAQEVVRDAEARGPRRPARHPRQRLAVDGVERLRRCEAAGLALGRGYLFLQEFEPHAIGEREPVDRPLILRVEPEIRFQLRRSRDRRVVDAHLHRAAEGVRAVDQRAALVDLVQVGVHVDRGGIVPPAEEHARPDVMRAGHI